MSAGTPIQNFERTASIPNNSLHLVEMGDGSGTKVVTQETLVEKIGEALKVGDLAQLQTEEKGSLVAAINEAAQSGGGGAAVDILDSKEEIEANTEAGKVAGAMAVKEMITELNDNLQGFTPILDETGKITGYKTAVGGADTVFPFKKGTVLPLGTIEWTHYSGKTNTYDFSQVIKDAGLNPSDYTAENIFFRPKATTYKSYSNATQTVERGYTYTDGIVTTTSGYVGSMHILTVTSLCYLVA